MITDLMMYHKSSYNVCFICWIDPNCQGPTVSGMNFNMTKKHDIKYKFSKAKVNDAGDVISLTNSSVEISNPSNDVDAILIKIDDAGYVVFGDKIYKWAGISPKDHTGLKSIKVIDGATVDFLFADISLNKQETRQVRTFLKSIGKEFLGE